MQQFAQSLGLNTCALKTDIETLKGLGDYQVIVYLSQQNHFVVLAGVDAEFIRLIDMDNNRFYYRQSLDCFKSAWDGTALIVANEPVELKGWFAKIDKNVLQRIVGTGEQSKIMSQP
jgi:ABC-type bacteriocin/lantibiotic exporter with double-glycine peptidase domain